MNELINAGGLHMVRYEAMCTAIAECHSVDEVKEIHDKTRAIEVYYKQADNTEAERKAADIRLRAERRVGELLRELERGDANTRLAGRSKDGAPVRASNNATPEPSEYAETLKRTGMSRQTAHRYQQLAGIPIDTFDEALADPVKKPSASGIVKSHAGKEPQIDAGALMIWRAARDFERRCNTKPQEVYAELTEAMQSDIRRIAPILACFWQALADEAR